MELSNTATPFDLRQTWKDVLCEEKSKDYFVRLLNFLESERRTGKIIYPPKEDTFNAFKHCEFHDVKVVILGQDPYFGAEQAHGLCFSVRPHIKAPPSLQNIFKEISDDLSQPIRNNPCLLDWAQQGVLLLNTVLSVEAGKPQSHAGKGWEVFTDHVISSLNIHRQGVVFLLWGSPAQRKANLIDANRHYILKTTHPSPLSAHRGFLGCKHFSKSNSLLEQQGLSAIDWIGGNLG